MSFTMLLLADHLNCVFIKHFLYRYQTFYISTKQIKQLLISSRLDENLNFVSELNLNKSNNLNLGNAFGIQGDFFMFPQQSSSDTNLLTDTSFKVYI